MFPAIGRRAARVVFSLALAALADAPLCAAVQLPDAAGDEKSAAVPASETAVLAGGCFWGMQAVFEHVKGVTHVTAGYAGGSSIDAHYMIVSTGVTGHAESVEVTYDPSRVTFGQLLKVYFAIAHDPTELNRQGPDTGTQYRSAIFVQAPEQEKIARAYIAQLNGAKVFSRPIVTQIAALKKFYPAESYHQDYAARHPDEPYIAFYDLPKLAALRNEMPELYVGNAPTN